MRELEQALDAWQAAIEERDVDAAGTLMHDDYALVIVHPAPATMLRGQWLATLPDYIVHEYAVEERRMDVMGDFALVLSRLRMTATAFGADRSGPFILSDAWVRDGAGDWRVWRRHSTPLTAGEMPTSRA